MAIHSVTIHRCHDVEQGKLQEREWDIKGKFRKAEGKDMALACLHPHSIPQLHMLLTSSPFSSVNA